MKMINKDYDLIDLVNTNNFYNKHKYYKIKEYRCVCPICELDDYTKNSLSIKSDFSVGNCFRCDTVFVNEYDPLKNEFSRVYVDKSSIEYNICKLDNLTDYTNLKGNTTLGRDYLFNRNCRMDIDKYKLKSNNYFIVIPFFINDELIYYQKRSINPNAEMKHFKPEIEHQPFYHIDNDSTTLIISEGVFDAIACDNRFKQKYDSIALCGKSMSHYQLWLLKEIKIYDKIIIYLDDTQLSMNLFNNLKNQFAIEPRFGIIKSNGDDPEEMLNKNIKLEFMKMG